MQLIADLLQKILAKDLDPGIVFEIFLCSLGWMIVLAVPMAVLVSTLQVFGGMSADNEILAVKASGQSMYFLLAPVLSAAMLLTVALMFFNNLIYPDANHRAAMLLTDISRKRPVTLIEPNVLIKDFSNYVLHVKGVNNKTGELKEIIIFSDKPGEDPSTTVAEHGTVKTTRDGKYLQLTLFNGETHSINREKKTEYLLGKFERQVIFISNIDSDFHRSESKFRGDREKSAKMLMDDINNFRESREASLKSFSEETDSVAEYCEALDSMASVISNDKDSIVDFDAWMSNLKSEKLFVTGQLKKADRQLERIIRNVEQQDRKINQFLVEVHKKYAIPVACIVFILIGAPLGIMAKRGGLGVGVTYSVFFFILYWAFLIGGESLADRLVVSPAVAMWSANVIIGICGLFLVIKMIRETTFISFSPVQKAVYSFFTNKKIKSLFYSIELIQRRIFRFPVWIQNKVSGILPSYLISIFFSNLFMVFSALIVVFVVVDYVSNLKRFENVHIFDIAQYYLYYMVWFIQVIAPIGFLLASMFSIGRLIKYSELTAMKAAGVSVRRLTIPLLFIGLVLSSAGFFLGEKFIPYANEKRKEMLENFNSYRQNKKQRITSRPRDFHRNFYYFGKNNFVYCFQEFRINPQSSKNVFREEIKGVKIASRVQAEKLLYQSGKWFFVNGTQRSFFYDTATVTTFDTLYDLALTPTPEEMVTRIKSIEEMSYWELANAIEKAGRRGEKVEKYLADLHFKIALPFMNFIVILLGISITVRAGKRGGAVLFGIGLLLTFTYWILSRVGLAMGQNGRLDPIIAAWGGNILFSLIGLVLYRKASQ